MLFFSCHSVCPGRVQITSTKTTRHNITIDWISPLDDNGIPYEVRLRFFYTEPHQTRAGSVLAPSTCTRWTVPYLPSDVSIRISLTALNKRSKAGPSTRTTVETKKICCLHSWNSSYYTPSKKRSLNSSKVLCLDIVTKEHLVL